MKPEASGFDFDEWRLLFETSPDAFEERRREAIESAIHLAPPDRQRRLRGLQWQIDVIRSRYKHPVAASSKLFQMMWDKVYGENGLQQALTSPQVKRAAVSGQIAQLISLRRPGEKRSR